MKLPYLLTFLRRSQHYQFEIRHLIVFFLLLIVFQSAVIVINQRSAAGVVEKTRQWYQQDAAERIANLTTMSFELLLESRNVQRPATDPEVRQVIQDFNIIFSQQLLDKTVLAVCILIPTGDGVVSIDDGAELYAFLNGSTAAFPDNSHEQHREAEKRFLQLQERLRGTEQTITQVEVGKDFHVFVPFVPRGEFHGAVYMKSRPDFTFLTDELSGMFAETTLIYSGLIVIALIGAFVISSRTLRERNEAQHLLFDEQKRHLVEQIHHEKELMFTKRIYHTHHKAEKFVGFIKEELRKMSGTTIDNQRRRIDKYASFVGRVIYDMKWYDPPVNTFRGPLFRTDVNEVIRFLVDHVFERGERARSFVFNVDLDPAFPALSVNEYVMWEAIEPIMQNAVDHGGKERLTIRIESRYIPAEGVGVLRISDTGKGIQPDLLVAGVQGVQKLFLERVSTREEEEGKDHSGYGCYIAHQIATERLGWTLTASNLPDGGAQFEFRIPAGRLS